MMIDAITIARLQTTPTIETIINANALSNVLSYVLSYGIANVRVLLILVES